MNTRWPRMMKRETAAEYCDLSVSAFEREVMSGRLPCGVTFGKHDHWDKQALDAAINRLSGNDNEPDYRQELRGRYDETA